MGTTTGRKKQVALLKSEGGIIQAGVKEDSGQRPVCGREELAQ